MSPAVLIPRPETETVVELALARLPVDRDIAVLDLGTGSGAIALSLGARRPDATIYATDISYRALSAARLNRRRLEVRNVRFCRGDLLEPLPPMLKGRTALILGNIPFVPPNEAPRFAYLAPTVAIRGPSVDGLALLRDLALQASALLEPGGRLIFQLAEWQWDPFAEFVASLGYRVVEPDLGIPSFGVAEWKGAEQ